MRDGPTHKRRLCHFLAIPELRDMIRAHRAELLAETGCGPLCAAILIGQTAGAEHFKSDAQFARVAGVAPIRASSGRHDRHRLDRGGGRQPKSRPARDRDHPRPGSPTDPRLPRTQGSRGQEPHRSDALP